MSLKSGKAISERRRDNFCANPLIRLWPGCIPLLTQCVLGLASALLQPFPQIDDPLMLKFGVPGIPSQPCVLSLGCPRRLGWPATLSLPAWPSARSWQEKSQLCLHFYPGVKGRGRHNDTDGMSLHIWFDSFFHDWLPVACNSNSTLYRVYAIHFGGRAKEAVL